MDVKDKRKLLIDFFMFFRENGEKNIGMSIEQFVDNFLKVNKVENSFIDNKILSADYINAEMVKRWHAKLVGLGEKEMKNDIKAMAEAYFLEKNVKWE